MKAILSMALLVALCGLVCAADEKKADPVGSWTLTYMIGDQQRTATLSITRDGDNLAGTMNWADQKDEKLKEVKLKDSDLTFGANRKVGDNTFMIDYKLTITGDTLKGTGAVDVNGDKRSFDIEGKREKKDK